MPHLSYRLRRSHRFLGITIGIQLLIWTVSGLYFSWSNLDEVHGDHLKEEQAQVLGLDSLVLPNSALKAIKNRLGEFELVSLQLIQILEQPNWLMQIQLLHGSYIRHDTCLIVDANTGLFRKPISRAEALQIAKTALKGQYGVKTVALLKSTGKHHEFRGGPLPAYAITFDHPDQPTFYISVYDGTIKKVRNSKWRVFDFFWMFHTMDYENRDNINNWVLRIFSVLGLLTVTSGFILFFMTLKPRRHA